ncbi:uncharacterized protein LOC120429751 [Culex pipiens pallens]|uniref:uncharacterized protein LOC120429751 n=1 Tax=Culex pipiens pallens TaxID=42434 RepID=UPI001953C712|nr:uncharacterized protein LOC120429751 [Culex pipiens pallens]
MKFRTAFLLLILLSINLVIAQKVVLPKQSRPRVMQEADLGRRRIIQQAQLMSSRQFQAFQRGNHFTITPTAKSQQQQGVRSGARVRVDALHGQIKKEFDASIVYLKYAAYFAQEKINLPGFEKFLFHAAGEEREHGIKLIEYALMRKGTGQQEHLPAGL